VLYRGRAEFDVVAFTAARIPDIDCRVYPPALAGDLYPDGIPILAEDELEAIVRERGVDDVVFSYSDVSHEHVMHVASRARAAGADFRLLSPSSTKLTSARPVVAVCAVRTGSGKSQRPRGAARASSERAACASRYSAIRRRAAISPVRRC